MKYLHLVIKKIGVFCNKYWEYPYRKLKMNNGETYLFVLESADELDKKLLENNK